MDELKPDKLLDAKGMSCPMPAVKTAMELEKMQNGQIVEVLTTDIASIKDLPKWAQHTGNEFLKEETDSQGINHIFIRKQ